MNLERSNSLTPLIGLGVRSIEDEAGAELLGLLPRDLLHQAVVVIRSRDAADPSVLPRFVGDLPLITPADLAPGALAPRESAVAAPIASGSVLYLPRGWTIARDSNHWRLVRLCERSHSPRSNPHVMPVDTLVPGIRDDSLDAFFKDIAREAGRSGVGVLTANCVSSGRLGLRAVAEAGGLTMLETSAVAEGGAAGISTAFVDHRSRIRGIATDLQAYLEHLRRPHRGIEGENLQREIAMAFPEIASRLREQTTHSFRYYKTSTVTRRVRRRMQVLRIQSLTEYLQRLRSHPAEPTALLRELLIGVTQFFRDPSVFQTLENRVLPELFERAERELVQARFAQQRELRIWVVGCSTGQEAYSLAILFAEQAERRNSSLQFQIVATDIDDQAIQEAGRGIYPRGIEREISSERLERYFRKEDGCYRVAESLRRRVQFVSHNLISDPPLSQLDLISCRNLLVYLRPHLQKKILPVFHRALRPDGVLLLGPSESTRTHSHLFQTLHTGHRISRRKDPDTEQFSRRRAASGGGRPAGGESATDESDREDSASDDWTQARITQLERELQGARANLEWTQLAIDAGAIGYWHWELGTEQLIFSRLQRQLLGLPADGDQPIRGSSVAQAVHPDDREAAERAFNASLDPGGSGSVKHELRIVRPDGSVRWLLVRGRTVFSEGRHRRPLRAMGISLDVTDRKTVEVSLLHAQAEAEAANRSKSEFLANMSHEIRTPMTAILGYADLVAEQLSDPVALEQMETIRRNGKFLLDIINDILDLSKIDAGKLEIRRQRCDIGQLITDVCSLMEVRVGEKGLQLIVEFEDQIPQTVETDPTRLRQVLVNLIGNAIKFTDQGMIEVVVRHHDAQQRLEVDVIDTGIGIAEEAQPGLFAPFMQVDTSINRQFGGTGLGLAITKRLAEMLGGEVSFQSTLGEGSRFTVAIATGPLEGIPRVSPVLRISSRESSIRSHSPLDARILVVDDSRDIRRLASTLLSRSGAKVTTADGGQAAVDAIVQAEAEGEPFSLVFMDVQMPGMDGPAAVGRLREAGYALPIVALTANAMQGDRERCLRRGYTDYLSKPLDVRTLSATLERYLTP